MVGDKTLMQQSLTGKDLGEADALRLAELLDSNTKAIARFVKIEVQLEDMVESYAKLKKGVRWLLGLLAANYAMTVSDFISTVL